jgi:hypothetical protein
MCLVNQLETWIEIDMMLNHLINYKCDLKVEKKDIFVLMQFSNICNFKYYREKQNCIYSIIYQNINSRKWQWRIISKIDKIHTQTIRFSNPSLSESTIVAVTSIDNNKLVGKDIMVISSDVNFMTLSNTRYATGNIQDFQ